jgi:hypothetical protein
MRKLSAAITTFAILLSGCATTQGPSKPAASAASAAFRADDFGWSKAAGRGRISGRLTYAVQGQAYSCADVPVLLTPETPWVRRRMSILYNSDSSAALPAEEVRRRTPPERSQDYAGFVRRTVCDASNQFTFSNLPDGAWFVITVARPSSGAGREMAIMRRVTVRGGEAVNLKL